jgi:hypothetical protein
MLNLYDRTVRTEAAELEGNASVESGQREASDLGYTTASQLLFLVESPDTLDTRLGTLA